MKGSFAKTDSQAQIRAVNGAANAAEGQKVPLILRIAEKYFWASYKFSKNSSLDSFGIVQLERLKSYYSEYAPVAANNGQTKLGEKYTQRLKEARALLAKGYVKLAKTERLNGDYTEAKKTIHEAKTEFGEGVPPEIMTEENKVLITEGLRLAGCGREDLAMQDLRETNGIDKAKMEEIKSIMHKTAKDVIDGNGHNGHKYTADEILEQTISK